jgi:RHS repeat-associated protein
LNYCAERKSWDREDGGTNTGSGSQARYISANGLQIARINGTNVLDYFYSDALGSVRKTINHIQLEQFSSNYKPFGPLHGASGSEKVKYTGKWEDSPTKLYYFGARYYDAELGRFISQDPIPIINQYAYANNNPLRFVDATGQSVFDLGEVPEWVWTIYNVEILMSYQEQAENYINQQIDLAVSLMELQLGTAVTMDEDPETSPLAAVDTQAVIWIDEKTVDTTYSEWSSHILSMATITLTEIAIAYALSPVPPAAIAFIFASQIPGVNFGVALMERTRTTKILQRQYIQGTGPNAITIAGVSYVPTANQRFKYVEHKEWALAWAMGFGPATQYFLFTGSIREFYSRTYYSS